MRRAAFAGVLALVAYVVACTWTGIDFGSHWDEYATVIKPAARSLRTGTVAPGRYLYPSVLHDITLAASLPDALLAPDRAAATVESKPFLLTMRRVVAAISALTILWVFLLVLVWRDAPGEAFLAALIAAGSWELQYHSRWLTVDPLMVQFAALTLLCAVAGYRRGSPWLLRASAIAAALACGSKYTAGLLLLTVLAACWFSAARGRRIAEALVLFAATFVLTTPGTLLETSLLLNDLRHQAQVYSSGWGVHTVSGPLQHARLLGEYVGLVLLSHTPAIAVFLFLAAAGGALAVAREDRRLAIVVLVFPVAYLLYFAMQRVMIVRNLLVVLPFLAPLAAIGIGELLRLVRTPLLRRIATAGAVAMLVVNLAWLLIAARTIRRPPAEHLAKLARYLDEHEGRRFALSPQVAAELRAFDGRERPVVNPRTPGVDTVVFFAQELGHAPFLANRRNSVERWFGAHEVNFNYYPTWTTSNRIVVMKPDNVRWTEQP